MVFLFFTIEIMFFVMIGYGEDVLGCLLMWVVECC